MFIRVLCISLAVCNIIFLANVVKNDDEAIELPVYMQAAHTQTHTFVDTPAQSLYTELLRVENLAHRDLLEDTALELNSMHSLRIV